MAVMKEYQADVVSILAKRYDNGADYWTTPDKHFCKGSPFSALNCAYLLMELGTEPFEPLIRYLYGNVESMT